jgi:hypothetical protein
VHLSFWAVDILPYFLLVIVFLSQSTTFVTCGRVGVILQHVV